MSEVKKRVPKSTAPIPPAAPTSAGTTTQSSSLAKHEDPASGAMGTNSRRNPFSYPTSMKLDAIRDREIVARVEEEKQLRAEVEKVRGEQRKLSDAKDANLRTFQPAADKFMNDISSEIDKLQIERNEVHDTMDKLKISQNELGQIRDQVKLLEFEMDPLHKEVQDLQRRYNEVNRVKEALEAQRGDTNNQALEDKIANEAKKVALAKTAYENKAAQKKSKEECRNSMREKLTKTGDLAQQFDAARKRLNQINAKLDELFAKKKVQRPQNKELDTLNKELTAIRTARDTLTARLDAVRAALKFVTFNFDPAYRADLVGKQGATLTQLQEDFGVAINIDTTADGEAVLLGAREDVEACIEAMKTIVANAERSRQKIVMTFDPSLAKGLIGAKGSNIERLQSVSGANIKIKDNEITVTGTTEAIDAAKKMIDEFISNSARAEIPFDSMLLDFIIGKGGSMVRKVEQESGAKNVRVLRDEGKIVISGAQSSVDKAKAMYTELLQNLTQNAFTLRADNQMIRSVIGAGGKTIREIQDTTSAIITCGRDMITIRGSKDAVASARKLIEDVGRREEVKVSFPSIMYSFLTTPVVQSNVATADETKQATPISPLDAVKAAANCDQVVALQRESVVIIRGRKEHVNQARSLLEDFIRTNRPVVSVIAIPEVLFSYFTRRGKKGTDSPTILQGLKSGHPGVLAIEISRPNSTLEVAASTREEANAVAAAVAEIIRSLEPNIRQVSIPAGRAGAVIGSGGKVISAIQQSTHTDIAVKKESNVVLIFSESADEANLAAAVAAVEEAAANNARQ